MTFSPKFFINNRKKLRESSNAKLMIISANGLMQRNADTTFKFSQDANFWYLTGINEPDLLLIINGDEEFLIAPGRSESRQAFDGAISDKDLTSVSGIKNIYDEETGWQKITESLKGVKNVGVLGAPTSYIKAHGIYTNPARKRLCTRLHKIDSELTLNGLDENMRDLRMIKQPEEIEAMQEAIDITAAALEAVKDLSKFKYEYEIEAEITKVMRAHGATGHAYEPIVASGDWACTLHYVENNAKLGKNDYVVIDVGAEVSHYAADITRTFHTGKPTERMKQVYDSVKEVHEFACKLLKPGISIREFEREVRGFLGLKLVELGLVSKGAPKEEINKYYPHATSHFLGLNVHDVGNYDEPLRKGMVLTVEPGIYIPEEGVGVRLEDDILITSSGIKNLSAKIPK